MTQFEFIRPHSRSGLITLSDAARIADSLRKGSLAVLPTETGYMLAALATSIPAIERAFAVKSRSRAQVMHVACAGVDMAASIGLLTPSALRLIGEFTPGPLSVVVAKTPLLPDDLVAVNGTVGIRIPDHPATLQVIRAVGAPLTATSLNVTGTAPVPVRKAELETMNWPAGETVHIVEDDESIRYDSGSTLVRLSGADIEILRPGPVSEADIREAARFPGYLESAGPA
ncbi:MAG TPA: L-threonylcarbamoyladenylate synthase [Streptosporangiaceae bacterium]|jgi:L-threonylcarbamoyladenylate synthase|nr:L-threonylcarbamoyladenylate synthase [Streptosporangiaceae bacterium]